MRKTAVFKMFVVRVVTLYVLFCAVAPCFAQENARGIVAEKIGAAPIAERPDPEIRFLTDTNGSCLLAVSSDLKFIVAYTRYFQQQHIVFGTILIIDFATGNVLKDIPLTSPKKYTIGISDDNKYITILYADNEKYIYSVESGHQVFDVNQHFTYFNEVDETKELPSFADDEELYEIFKSNRKCLSDNEKKIYICGSPFCDYKIIDANAKQKYDFSFHDSYRIRAGYCKTYIGEDHDDSFLSMAVAYPDGHIIRYSTQGEVLTVYDFDSTDYKIWTIQQQDKLLIACSEKKIYVYDLYSGKILKQIDNEYGVGYCSPYVYYNSEENYIINISNLGGIIACNTIKVNLEKNSCTVIPSVGNGLSTFASTNCINLDNTLYFLAFDDNLGTVITKWNHLDNTVETVKTGLFFSDITSFELYDIGYCFYYNKKNNMLYALFWEDDINEKIIQILKYDLITNKCFLYHPKKEYRFVEFVYGDDFDTAFFSTYDYSNRAMVNLKDFTLIESSAFLEEKVNECGVIDYPSEYIYALTAQKSVCLYNSKGELVRKYNNREEYRKSKDYRYSRMLTYSGVDVGDFYGDLYHVQFVQGGESLIYTPEGFFCGSEWATQNLVYIVDGMDVIGIDQVYDTYYRPDLVAAKIRGENISSYASAVQLASLVRSGRAPAVSLSGIPSESSGRDMTFGVCVRNTGGGIGAVNLLLNGKAIRLSDGVASADGETVEFRHTVTLQNGSNTLEAFALNGAGLVESVRSSAEVVWRGATEKPDLYVLTAAVNRYRDKSLWLNFAVPDAQAVAEGFQKQQSGLYRSVHVFQLNDGDVTKENLAAEFSRLSEQIRADDVFVFFVSGHGTTYNDGDYYYLPADFRYTSEESIPIGGISKNDLLANLSKIKAGKTLVMLDTCNSGAFVSDSNQRGLSEKTAIDRLTRATGHATLAASSDSQSAMEGYNGHGVFTYVLLEGIAGAADSDGDGYVTLNELSAFVEREVPERSYEKWGYEQVPQKDLRRQDFPIAGK